MLKAQDHEQQLSLDSTTMESTADSDIFRLNLEVTSLKILIKRDYHLSLPESNMQNKKKERKRYWVIGYLWMESR